MVDYIPLKSIDRYDKLVGGLEHFLFFHSVGNVIIPTDELIFFRGQPPNHRGCLLRGCRHWFPPSQLDLPSGNQTNLAIENPELIQISYHKSYSNLLMRCINQHSHLVISRAPSCTVGKSHLGGHHFLRKALVELGLANGAVPGRKRNAILMDFEVLKLVILVGFYEI